MAAPSSVVVPHPGSARRTGYPALGRSRAGPPTALPTPSSDRSPWLRSTSRWRRPWFVAPLPARHAHLPRHPHLPTRAKPLAGRVVRGRAQLIALLVTVVLVLTCPDPPAAAAAGAAAVAGAGAVAGAARAPAATGFLLPVPPPPIVLTAFAPPANRFGAGHRGVDLAIAAGSEIRSAGTGVVVFAADLAGRGVVSIEHTGGLRTTYEPVSASVTAGAAVSAGQVIGVLQAGHPGCAPSDCLHWGARLPDRVYLDPLSLLTGWEVRLLPWADP
jgi:murein DD-endopeptidase MepM/ murein hydrolase activator NlpD